MKIWAALFSLALALPGGVWFLLGDTEAAVNPVPSVPGLATIRYRLDSSRSKFIVHAHRGGLAWFKGHDHFVGVGDFTGFAEITPDALNPASLEMTIRTASLAETSDVFTPQQKGIIKKELDEIVLETSKYPEITFRSTDVKGNLKNNAYEIKIGGDITLHGVTKHIVIPATINLEGDTLHAIGKFNLKRSDFKVKATSAFHGTVRVKNKLTFDFDIRATRV